MKTVAIPSTHTPFLKEQALSSLPENRISWYANGQPEVGHKWQKKTNSITGRDETVSPPAGGRLASKPEDGSFEKREMAEPGRISRN